MSQCSKCGNQLDFEPLDMEVYDYIDALCNECFQGLHQDNEEDTAWWRCFEGFSHEDFIAINEMNCD